MTERRRKKGKLFSNDVKSLLYAFGDVENPLPETVSALEDVLVTYIIDTVRKTVEYLTMIESVTNRNISVMKPLRMPKPQDVRRLKWRISSLS